MAALGQQHERRFLLAAPVAAHEAVRLMPVADVFQRLNTDDLTHIAALNRRMDLLKEGRIAQHMANHDGALIFLCRLLDQPDVLKADGNRLFQQQMIALFQRGDRMPDMLAILRADQRDIRQALPCKHLLAGFKTHLLRHAVSLFDILALLFNRLGDGRNLHPAFQQLGKARIRVLSAVAQTADDRAHGIAFLHKAVPPSRLYCYHFIAQKQRCQETEKADGQPLPAVHPPLNPCASSRSHPSCGWKRPARSQWVRLMHRRPAQLRSIRISA